MWHCFGFNILSRQGKGGFLFFSIFCFSLFFVFLCACLIKHVSSMFVHCACSRRHLFATRLAADGRASRELQTETTSPLSREAWCTSRNALLATQKIVKSSLAHKAGAVVRLETRRLFALSFLLSLLVPLFSFSQVRLSLLFFHHLQRKRRGEIEKEDNQTEFVRAACSSPTRSHWNG